MTPLVLLPGMNCTEDLWSETELGAAQHAALDRADMTAQTAHLLEVLPMRFALAGLSLGAIVALALAQAAPHRVAGLVLMSTNAKPPTAAQRAGWQEWRDRLGAGESARDLQATILPALLSEAGLAQPALVRRVLAMGEATGEEGLGRQLLLQDSRIDLRPGLPELTMPTLVLSGDDDALCPPSFHREIADALPDAQFASIPGGHLLPMENPHAVGSAIRSWRSAHAF